VDKAASAIRRADLVLLQLEVPIPAAERAASIARKAGVPVLLNPAPMTREPLPRSFLANVEYLVPNQGELVRLADKASERMAAERMFGVGVKALVVTLGARGARLITPDKVWPVPGFRVRALDTVGAGDCFCGYLAAALAQGMEMERASVLASAAAAISVTRPGAQPSMPRRAEADRLARTAPKRDRVRH
jgi:ribokinase